MMKDRSPVCTYVGTLGLTDEENSIIESLLPKGAKLMATDKGTDLIASNTFLNIFRPEKMEPSDLECVIEFYAEVGIEAPQAHVIADADTFHPEGVGRIMKVWPSFQAMSHRLNLIILMDWSHNKRSSNFSATLAYAIQILSLIRRNPGITTKELAERMEMSARSVQRYIETLRVAGEWIEYDQSIRGWKLTAGRSVLWGDYDS